MKNGRSLMELAQELERQRNAKRDYLLDTRNLEMGFVEAGAYQMMMRNDSKNVSTLLGVGEIAHRQIGSRLASLLNIMIRCAQRIPNCWRRT